MTSSLLSSLTTGMRKEAEGHDDDGDGRLDGLLGSAVTRSLREYEEVVLR